MTLQEKYNDLIENESEYSEAFLVQRCVKLTETFAISFYEWRSTCLVKNIDQYTNREAIEIYKKEKQL